MRETVSSIDKLTSADPQYFTTVNTDNFIQVGFFKILSLNNLQPYSQMLSVGHRFISIYSTDYFGTASFIWMI